MTAPRGALPAWKQALLERKRAKLAAGAAAELPRVSPGPPPTPSPGAEPGSPSPSSGERLVVAESLGPLRENPFMRLESERRRRRWSRRPPPAPPAAPVPPAEAPAETPALARLLELYSSMPGIRTIRADNILIIESSPDGDGLPGPCRRRRRGRREEEKEEKEKGEPPRPPGPAARDPRLLLRGGSPVTEIRAAEVVIYEPQPAPKAPPTPPPPWEPPSEPGRVSRLLQKFDGRRPRGRARGGEPPCPESLRAAVAAVPKAHPEEAASSARPDSPFGGFVQKIGANSFTVNPRGRRLPGSGVPGAPGAAPAPLLSNGALEPEEAALEGPRGPRGASAAPTPQPVPSPPSPAAVALSPIRANSWKPKSEETVLGPPLPPPPSASPNSGATAGLPRPALPLASNGTFEIRPALKPDLSAIPVHDLQAQALASLRLNSRNSFLFVPRRKGEAPSPPGAVETPPALAGGPPTMLPEKQAETLVPVTYIDEDLVEPDAGCLPPLKVLSPRLEGFDVPHDGNLALEMEDAALPTYRSHPAGVAAFTQKNGNTFTIVPKRKPPVAGLETFNRAWLPEEEEEEEEEGRARGVAGVPHQELGQLLKKRYPTVNEIEVIGGYLSLDKSCMSKSGSRRKKMKISFNETSLQTMFEYPSESSLVEEEAEEEEEEEEEYATEVDETPTALFIPRPTSTAQLNTTNPGLPSYTRKHSLEFDQWQEKHPEGMPESLGAFAQDTDLLGSQVMLTPADKSSLSDFSSEPALYF